MLLFCSKFHNGFFCLAVQTKRNEAFDNDCNDELIPFDRRYRDPIKMTPPSERKMSHYLRVNAINPEANFEINNERQNIATTQTTPPHCLGYGRRSKYTDRSIRLIAYSHCLTSTADLDGTLLRANGTVSSRNAAALRRAQASGIQVMFASGRPPRSIHKVISMLNGTVPDMVICCNGGMIYDPRERRVLLCNEIDLGNARACIELLLAAIPGVGFACEIPTDSGSDFKCDKVYLDVRKKHMYYDYQLFVDPARILDGESSVIKIMVLHPSLTAVELFERLPSKLRDHDASPVAVTYSSNRMLDISAHGVSKGSILAKYCAERQIAADEVVAFGDMVNDIEMMEWVGMAVAMGNSGLEVLKVATKTTLSNEEDGVAVEIERILDLAER
ncbi:HAD-like domain-containing protein [Jimgerdemannia flammicorona]|uniref:HAD-like domain-containing protein n=1 Tax=Jimgerdemannia flammicorona TaxID=994334 RepID=A0A433D741_9FUNG|nr:HAD-like domain-containing protein [Jimgerdemannia flammicorona]